MPQSHQGQEVPSHHFQGSPSPEGQAVLDGRLGHPVMFASAGTAGALQQNLPGPSWASSFKAPAGLRAASQAPLTPRWCKAPQKHWRVSIHPLQLPGALQGSPSISSGSRHPVLRLLDPGPCAGVGWCPSPSEFSDFLETRCLCQPTSELYNVHPLLFRIPQQPVGVLIILRKIFNPSGQRKPTYTSTAPDSDYSRSFMLQVP